MTVKINYYPNFTIPADQAEACLRALIADPHALDIADDPPGILRDDGTLDFGADLLIRLNDAYKLDGDVTAAGDVHINDCDDECAGDLAYLLNILAPFVTSGGWAMGQNWEDIPARNWRMLFLDGKLYYQKQLEVWDTPEVIDWDHF